MDYLNRIKSVIVYLTEFDSSISFTSVGIDYDEMIEFLADERYDPSGYYCKLSKNIHFERNAAFFMIEAELLFQFIEEDQNNDIGVGLSKR